MIKAPFCENKLNSTFMFMWKMLKYNVAMLVRLTKLGEPKMFKGAALKMMIFSLVVVLVTAGGIYAGFVWGSASSTSPSKITIAIQPTGTASEIASKAKELEQFLEARVGVDVEIYIPTTYAAVVEALRFGNAEVAFMSAWPAYLANKLAGAEVVLAEVREVVIGQEKKNETYYYSYWVVSENSTINSLSELRGMKAAFPSTISTSGYVFPTARLVELGLITKPTNGEADPDTFFGDVLIAGGYSQGWAALKAGQVDVTVIAGDVSEKLYREVLDNTKILEQQGPIPSHAVVFNKDFKDPLRSKLIDALLELEDNKNLMRKFISGIFVGFKVTTTSEHLARLDGALNTTGYKFSEKFG